MSELERTPLLSATSRNKLSAEASVASLESTPLLSSTSATPRYDGERDEIDDNEATSVRSHPLDAHSIHSVASMKSKSSRWPSYIAMMCLATFAGVILVVAYMVPAAVEEYAKQAAVLEPTNLSLQSITADGVRARIQANIRLDGQRVQNEHVRRVGRVTTWLLRELGTEETKVNVTLPEYGNILLGTAAVPALTINIMDGHNTAVDFVADLIPGDAEGIRTIANEWLEGRLDVLRLKGKADIQLKTGFISLGTHTVSESLTFEANKLPQLPEYNITKINFEESPIPDLNRTAMAADVSVTAFNMYPISVDVPELGFEVLLPGCNLDDHILVAATRTSTVAVRPQQEVVVNAHGLIKELPKPLTKVCPDSDSSPLDMFFKKYLDGETATVFVRGQKQTDSDTPDWLGEILSSITVPVPFPGRSFDNLIRSFSLSDVHFSLPNPLAEPGDPDADPKVSGNVEVLAALPSEMNLSLNVTGVAARADVFYRSNKLGELELEHWQKASSKKVAANKDHEAMLKIMSRINDAPLNVTDADVLTDVIQTLIFGGKEVILDVKALVDVKVQTVLGQLVLKDVPAEGKIPVKPLSHDLAGSLQPKVENIEIINTGPTSIELKASVNVTNPTPYSARIPYINIHLLSNGTLIGEATARSLDIKKGSGPPGKNSNLVVTALWKPSFSGDQGVAIGRELISQYISGFNTSITIKGHRNSIPSQPVIGEALSRLNLTVSAPRLRLPGGKDDDEKTHFIRDATFHVLSSRATFTLVSPLQHNTMYIDHVNATALYNHTEPVGRIEYDLPFAAPPGASTTPKLPVTWSLDSVGYDKLKQALGGTLKLDATATVGVRLGVWTETFWYVGKGIGASIRI